MAKLGFLVTASDFKNFLVREHSLFMPQGGGGGEGGTKEKLKNAINIFLFTQPFLEQIFFYPFNPSQEFKNFFFIKYL